MSAPFRTSLFAAGIVLYPFVCAFLVRQGWSRWVLLLFAVAAIRRAIPAATPFRRFAGGLLAALLAAGAVLAEELSVRLIPAYVQLSLASLFGVTLLHPPSLIERLVLLQYPELKPGLSPYLRRLTWAWTGLFAVNAVLCAGLAAFADEGIWMGYTGFGVYLPMVALATGEIPYRRRRFPDLEMPRAMDSLRVMSLNGHKIFRELGG